MLIAGSNSSYTILKVPPPTTMINVDSDAIVPALKYAYVIPSVIEK